MKKIISIFLLAMLLLTFVSCGGDGDDAITDTPTETGEPVGSSNDDTTPETVDYEEALNDNNWSVNY